MLIFVNGINGEGARSGRTGWGFIGDSIGDCGRLELVTFSKWMLSDSEI